MTSSGKAFIVDFHDEVEEEIIKQEPKDEPKEEDWSDTDVHHEIDIKIEAEENLEYELNVEEPARPRTIIAQEEEAAAMPLKSGHESGECDTPLEERHLQVKPHTKHIINQKKGKRKLFLCERCNYKTDRKVHLQLHIINKHLNEEEIRWFKCERCDYKAKHKSHLQRHMISKHLNGEEITWFQCEQCDYRNKFKWRLKKHMINKHVNEFSAENATSKQNTKVT